LCDVKDASFSMKREGVMINDISFFFIFFAGFMSWTISLGQIIKNKKTTYDYLFSAIMFCLGTLQLLDGLLVAGKLRDYPFLVFWYLPFLAMIAPLFYLSFKSANDDSFRFRIADYFHLLIGVVPVPFLIPLSMLDADTKMSFVMQTLNFSNNDPLFRLYSGLFLAIILSIIGYQVYFVRECLFMLNMKLIREKRVSPYLIIIILINFPLEIAFLGTVIAMSFINYSGNIFFSIIQTMTALSFVLTLVVFIMEKKGINFFRLLHIEIENRRYEVSRIRGLDVEELLSRICSLVEDEKIFCDESLSVNSMAQRLGIEPYQLSQIINEHFNLNFNYFINKYRIEEAKRILLAEKERTITSVAYAVGFNSASVFYEWFKRIVGISPKNFRGASVDVAR